MYSVCVCVKENIVCSEVSCVYTWIQKLFLFVKMCAHVFILSLCIHWTVCVCACARARPRAYMHVCVFVCVCVSTAMLMCFHVYSCVKACPDRWTSPLNMELALPRSLPSCKCVPVLFSLFLNGAGHWLTAAFIPGETHHFHAVWNKTHTCNTN